MVRQARWLPIALVLAVASACCTASIAPPPGLTHTVARPRTPKRKTIYRPPGGEATEVQPVDVQGVGPAIVIPTSPAPGASPSPQPSP